LPTDYGITPEDWDGTHALQQRRAEGEYILKFERPTTKKFLQHDFAQLAAETAQQYASNYDRVFAEMGIDPITADQLKIHASKIHRATLEVDVAIQQVLHARNDYDSRIRSSVSEEQYTRYRQYEESRPAVREYENLASFAKANGVEQLDPLEQQTLVDLIQETKAHHLSYHLPYDGLPHPAVGTASVTALGERRYKDLVEKSNLLLQRAEAVGLSEGSQALLQKSYSSQAEEILKSIQPSNRSLIDPSQN
jgi:hypothetical protein